MISPGSGRLRPIFELGLGVVSLLLACWLVLPSRLIPGSSHDGPRAGSQLGTAASEDDTASVLARVPRVASYTLEARLDPYQHRIEGAGTIKLVNTSTRALDELYFHLYLNAFKNERTLFLRSPLTAGRSGRGAREYGYLDVKSLTAVELGGVDLWKARDAHSPDDPEDETDIRVPLPRPLEPGAALTLELKFEAQLPRVIERTGYEGTFHFAGQWFPKLAKLEPDGSFAHFAFHPQAEFYANFGRYDVTLDVPAGYDVGATGERVSDVREGDRRRVRHVADPVHDFAWSAWDGFAETRRTVDGVSVSILTPKGYHSVTDSTLATLESALPEFSRRFGRYPYSTLTVVHPPEGATAAGGMEYPTLITTGGAWYAPRTGVRAIEAVTAHELAHQWFYGLIATNEARFPFLDEGLTSFAELVALRSRFGHGSLVDGFGVQISIESVYRALAVERGGDEPIGAPASDFTSFRNLGSLVYFRTAIVLETLGRVFGRGALDRALSVYAREYRFRHPGPEALVQTLREHLGPEAARAFEQAVFERGTVNYVVRELPSRRLAPKAGYFERSSGRERIQPNPGEAQRYQSRVTIYREGAIELPVDVLLIAEDGARRLEHWDGRGATRTFFHEGDVPLAQVVVDPERRVLIDDDLFDNHLAASPAPVVRVHERLAYVAALVLGGLAP